MCREKKTSKYSAQNEKERREERRDHSKINSNKKIKEIPETKL